jgi:hypothetical protein
VVELRDMIDTVKLDNIYIYTHTYSLARMEPEHSGWNFNRIYGTDRTRWNLFRLVLCFKLKWYILVMLNRIELTSLI